MNYTNGGQFELLDGKEYVGSYVKLPNGSIYTGEKFVFKKSKRLYPILVKKDKLKLTQMGANHLNYNTQFLKKYNFDKIRSLIVKKNEKSKDDIISRFFLIKSKYQIYQTSKQEYEKHSNNLLYKKQKFKWKIKGSRKQIYMYNLKVILHIKNFILRQMLKSQLKTM